MQVEADKGYFAHGVEGAGVDAYRDVHDFLYIVDAAAAGYTAVRVSCAANDLANGFESLANFVDVGHVARLEVAGFQEFVGVHRARPLDRYFAQFVAGTLIHSDENVE